MKFKQIWRLGPDAAHGRTALLDQALLRPAKPAHSRTESGPTRPSRLTEPTRMGCAGRRGRRQLRCTDKTTPSTSTSSCTCRAPTRRRGAREATGVGSGYGLTGDVGGFGIRRLPSLPVRRGNDQRGGT
jgi:hypothetical protein